MCAEVCKKDLNPKLTLLQLRIKLRKQNNFQERLFSPKHFPLFLGWYYFLTITSLVGCCQNLKSSLFVCLFSFFSLWTFKAFYLVFLFFFPLKTVLTEFFCSFKYLQNPSASDLFLLNYRVKSKIA